MRKLYIILLVISFISCEADNKQMTTEAEPCGYNDSITEADMIDINQRMDSVLYPCAMRMVSRPTYMYLRRN